MGRVNGQLQVFRQRIDEAYEQATKEKGIVTAEILKNVIVDANTIPMTLLACLCKRERSCSTGNAPDNG